MTLYIRKRTVHLGLLALVALAASVTVVAAQQQQQLKQSAQTKDRASYTEPPMFGCLQIGEGTNQSCSSKLLKSELDVTLNGFDATGRKVFYNQTLEATLTITNIGDLPMKISKLAVSGRPVNQKYKVDFKPAKENFTINPKDSVTLTGAKHTFNNPDPGGPWEIVSLMVDDNGQSVSDVEKVDLVVDTTCKALLRVQLTDAEITALDNLCKQNRSGSQDGIACDDFCKIFTDKCGEQAAPQPDNACLQACQTGSSCYPANTKGANGAVPACNINGKNTAGEACSAPEQCASQNCGPEKKCL